MREAPSPEPFIIHTLSIRYFLFFPEPLWKNRKKEEIHIASEPLDMNKSQWLFNRVQHIVISGFDFFKSISERYTLEVEKVAKTIYDKRTLTHNLVSNYLEKWDTISAAISPKWWGLNGWLAASPFFCIPDKSWPTKESQIHSSNNHIRCPASRFPTWVFSIPSYLVQSEHTYVDLKHT